MDTVNSLNDAEHLNLGKTYEFPVKPFEQIGFALSGGGFRAASYGLGVMSLMDFIKTDRDHPGTLLQKVRFVSSASGGTITLTMYMASLCNKVPFKQFFKIVNGSMQGDQLVNKAIALLSDDSQWTGCDKSRNIINAFSLAYDQQLFSSLLGGVADLGCIMDTISVPDAIHVEEFCFNASEFYSGISFRFQGGASWMDKRFGQFGNNGIGINWTDPQSVTTLKKLKLADVLAASSCFPMGFEPMAFPKDFTYHHGPTSQELKNAIVMKPHSWDQNKGLKENERSTRAKAEKEFIDKKEFGLMDGGICDNQGLFSMLLANDRNGEDPRNRFDLMMVSDVTSYFMTPYKVPEIKPPADFTGTTLNKTWRKLTSGFATVKRGALIAWVIAFFVAIASILPFICGDRGTASIMLMTLGILLFGGMCWAKLTLSRFLSTHPAINRYLSEPDLEGLVRVILPNTDFMQRTTIKIINYIQHLETGILMQMVMARLNSSMTMIGDVFLKHIRRLIYDQFYENERFTYRRFANLIYQLTYTNDLSRQQARFEPKEQESQSSYNERRTAFRADLQSRNPISDQMKKTAELAYNTGTTLWFEDHQENPGDGAAEKNREALIATGQFTTCHNFLRYATSLKHSRHFTSLHPVYQDRILYIEEQLTELVIGFQSDPYHLFKKYK